MTLRFMTAGESHGPALVALVDGLPAGLSVSEAYVNRDLARRQLGYGRSARMQIEKDEARILSGVRFGRTMGSPVTLYIENRDWENWREVMSVGETGEDKPAPETRPRPGHGDFAGMLKFGTRDARDVLERASARETAARVAAGSLARRLLEEVGVKIMSRVISIGGVSAQSDDAVSESLFEAVDEDPLRCDNRDASEKMKKGIDSASQEGDTLGGVFQVAAFGVPPGLGSPSPFDRRLSARLCGALASIPGVKGVEVGKGFAVTGVRGSEAHDEIRYDEARGVYRTTNRAGGLEAGMTNGEPILLQAAMKPIPTLGRPLETVDCERLEPAQAFKERADVCAVPSASIVGEAVVALSLADALLAKFGGDSLAELLRNHEGYLEQIKKLWRPGGRHS
jgi:chorismate synthase